MVASIIDWEADIVIIKVNIADFIEVGIIAVVVDTFIAKAFTRIIGAINTITAVVISTIIIREFAGIIIKEIVATHLIIN